MNELCVSCSTHWIKSKSACLESDFFSAPGLSRPIGVCSVPLVRFDAVYFGHFKCNLRRIVDYTNLDGYLRDLYQQPGTAETVNFDHIKRHYYITHREINPTSIVPLGPVLDFTRPAGREHL